MLITDAMQAAGMPDGRYTLCGENVEMQGGVVRTASGGLAGSTLALDAAVRNMVEHTGVAPENAIHMASLHPARLLGMDHLLGSLAPRQTRQYYCARCGFTPPAELDPVVRLFPCSPFTVCSVGLTEDDRKAFLFLSLIFAFPFAITLFVLFLFRH